MHHPRFLDSLPDIVLAVETNALRIASVNRAEPVFGHLPNDLVGRSLPDLLTDLPALALRALASEAAAVERTASLLTRVRAVDGSMVAVDVRFGRAVAGLVPVVVRENRMAEELRDANHFLDQVIENIPDMLFVKDAATLAFTRFNRAGERLLGLRREEVLGKTDHAFWPKEQADFFQEKDRETLRDGKPVDVAEEPIDTRARGRRWLHTRKVPVLDAEGRPRFLLGMSEDITARKATEEELRRVLAELRDLNLFLDAIVENIPDMIFVKDAETLLFKRFNRAGEELLGWSRAELLGKTDHDFYPKEQADFFHAKDRETLRNKVLVDIAEEPIDTRAHGRRWLHTKKVPVLDESRAPKYLLGISEDITARKEAEERAQSLERELAQIARSARDAMAAWTPQGTVVTWNPAAEALLGIPSTEAIGAQLQTLLPEALSPQYRAAQESLGAGGELPLYQTTVRHRDGRDVEVEVSLFNVLDGDGHVVRHAAIARDTTEIARLRRATEIMSARDTRPSLPVDGAKRSRAMQEVLDSVAIVSANRDATVLLLGETGVGKGWLARQIHGKSPRAALPFFEVNAAGLGSQLVESELFGHERGAFTGATAQKRGIVEVAEGGTLFLDEIGELPLGVQAQLLTFLDQRTYRRVGGTRTLRSDVRLLAATNVDLKAAVARGTFRRDLFYRLNVVPIVVPPLRERRDEIPALVDAILVDLVRRSSRSGERAGRIIDRTAVAALVRHDWPGNVRELRNALERALILSRGGTVEVEHLPAELRDAAKPKGRAPASTRLDDVEREHILRVLDEAGGNRTRAAELLGIGRSTLKRKLAELRVASAGDDP